MHNSAANEPEQPGLTDATVLREPRLVLTVDVLFIFQTPHKIVVLRLK
jgi:hypothetical protein